MRILALALAVVCAVQTVVIGIVIKRGLSISRGPGSYRTIQASDTDAFIVKGVGSKLAVEFVGSAEQPSAEIKWSDAHRRVRIESHEVGGRLVTTFQIQEGDVVTFVTDADSDGEPESMTIKRSDHVESLRRSVLEWEKQ
jgi:hypothetical protein